MRIFAVPWYWATGDARRGANFNQLVELVRAEAKVCRYCARELTAFDFVQQGIVALKAGRSSDARQLFRCAIERDADSEDAWGWLGKAADTDKERERCLESVLSINPENVTAQRELELL